MRPWAFYSKTVSAMNWATRIEGDVRSVMRWVIIVLSLLLIVFISMDTFQGVNFLDSHRYMLFQFWVCVVFLFDFFLELWMTPKGGRGHYFATHLLFLLLSVPYLNLIMYFDIQLSEQAMFYVRFIPLARGALAMAIVAGAMSSHKISSLFFAYVIILLSVIYFSSLLFMYREHGLNPEVTNYGQALWWCFMESTTIGAPFNPVTTLGKILAIVLSGTGIIMFPLFTVYITSIVVRAKRTQRLVENEE